MSKPFPLWLRVLRVAVVVVGVTYIAFPHLIREQPNAFFATVLLGVVVGALSFFKAISRFRDSSKKSNHPTH
jgi:hypothetical protein